MNEVPNDDENNAPNTDIVESDIEEIITVEDMRKHIEFDGRAPRIQFGDTFNDMSTNAQIEYLKNLSSTMNHAADLMQQERNSLALEIVKQSEFLVNAQGQIDIQKTINTNLMTTINEQTQSQAKKNSIYEEKIKALQGLLDDANNNI